MSRQNASRNAKATLKLALPAMGSRAGILVMLSVDALMVGHEGQAQLAYLGISFAIQAVLMLISVGFLQGIMVLTSQAFGAREYDYCAQIWRVGLILAALLGSVAVGISLAGEPLLLLLGQSPDLAEGGGRVIVQFGWGLPAMMLYIACSYFLEGIQRPRIAMVIMAGAVVLNTGLNAIFLYVLDGGAPGAAAATSITRWVIFFTIFSYIAFIMADRAEFGVRRPGALSKEAALRVWRFAKRAFKLGAPMGILQGAESSAFSMLTITAGLLGEAQLAASTVTMQLIQLVFMLAIGMSAATAVRVGFAVGASDKSGVAWAGWTGAVLIVLVVAPLCALLALAPGGAGRIFTTTPEVLEIARFTIVIAAGLLIFDSIMTVLLGALRGAGDVWVPMIFHASAMWLVMVPLARYLTLDQEWGVPGLFWGMFGGVLVAGLFAGIRFYFVSRRDITRA